MPVAGFDQALALAETEHAPQIDKAGAAYEAKAVRCWRGQSCTQRRIRSEDYRRFKIHRAQDDLSVQVVHQPSDELALNGDLGGSEREGCWGG